MNSTNIKYNSQRWNRAHHAIRYAAANVTFDPDVGEGGAYGFGDTRDGVDVQSRVYADVETQANSSTSPRRRHCQHRGQLQHELGRGVVEEGQRRFFEVGAASESPCARWRRRDQVLGPNVDGAACGKWVYRSGYMNIGGNRLEGKLMFHRTEVEKIFLNSNHLYVKR